MKTILITCGAGFVGSNIGLLLKRDFPKIRILALDNLKRNGSYLNLDRLKKCEIEFIHGDIRNPEDLKNIPPFELLIECSAEPSVQAGLNGDPDYLIHTNLFGSFHCFELVRKYHANIVFLSTSRVYSIQNIRNLHYIKEKTRFTLSQNTTPLGVSAYGFSEEFPTSAPISLYGASKLASEILLLEYIHQYEIKGIINRCSILTGPWQMGKIDQGVAVLWAAAHIYNKPLSYKGYQGKGYQVRDFLHIEDLYRLLLLQIKNIKKHNGNIYNIGGGNERSLSLLELTNLCLEISGKKTKITPNPEPTKADIPYFVSDSRKIINSSEWTPKISVREIMEDIIRWIMDNKEMLRPILA